AARLAGADGRIAAVLAADGRRFEADAVLVAAGAWSAPLLATAAVAIPVHARKRDIFVVDSPAVLADCPLLIDTSGVWVRPEGRPGRYLAGAPPRGEDRDDLPLDEIDHGLFEGVIWPALAARIPAFEALRVASAWAGYYEMNTFDHNGLAGPAPGWDNLHLACGFSGHGMQQAPAVGRSMASWLARGAWDGVDLTPLAPRRIAEGRPLLERNVI
ncbi:MAG: FAD-binding oxidoreductase, partial [Burkholderiaceae bacterium]|nr:FAD-binding oxidoreductase [Burkholderiaceae bacterium]